MTMTGASSTLDEIVDRLKDSVWTLICADQMDAALVLLQASVDEFDKAYRLEMMGIQSEAEPQQAQPTEEATTCVSLLHTEPDCHQAIAAGVLTTQACAWCRTHPRGGPAPAIKGDPSATGTLVYKITSGKELVRA